MSASSSRTKSPRAKTPRSSPSLSPTRATRMEEKEELQELNKRLEFYILRNREKDASQGVLQRELDLLRERTDEELAHAEQVHQQQLEELRKSREAEKQKSDNLQAELNRVSKELETTKRILAQSREAEDRLRQDNEQLRKDLSAQQFEVAQLTDANQQLEDERKILQASDADAKEALENAAEESAAFKTRAEKAEASLQNLKEDSSVALSKAQAEIKRLRAQVDDLSHRHTHVEEELRKELTAQLATIIEKRQQEWEEEKNDGLAQLKEIYDEKIAAYRDHLARAGHELEILKAQKLAAVSEAEKVKTSFEEFQAVKTTMKKRIEELEEAVKSEKARPARQLAEKNEIIRHLKAAFKRKDEEFDALMDVKIALAMEIKAYRQMLEKEESRLGYKSPTSRKKRKLTEEPDEEAVEAVAASSSFSSSSSGFAAVQAEAPLRFSGMDVHGKYLTIRNNSTEDQQLTGWYIRAQSTGLELKLPEITLKTGSSITIWTSEEHREKHNPPTDIFWDAEGNTFDDVNGDVAELVDPQDNVIAEAQINPEHPAVDQDMSGDEEDKPKENCVVM